MTAYRMTLEYDGTHFSGWQAQRDERTVEGVLRDAIRRATGEEARTVAAGRTDAGAHAHGQVVGFALSAGWDADRLAAAVNAHLPADAVVVDAAVVADGFHARRDAVRRTYRYVIVTRDQRAAVTRRHAWVVRGPIDLEAMRAAAAALAGTHDFAAFGRAPNPGGTTLRSVHEVRVDRVSVAAAGTTRVEGVAITVTADAFLRGMMRAFAGALVDVGRGRLSAQQVASLVERGRPSLRLTVAPAHGLHQWNVEYRSEALAA